MIKPIPYDTRASCCPAVTVRVRDAGHILGSSSVEMWVERRATCAASWCSRAISGSTTRPSCRTCGSSSPPTRCSWRAPTATACIAAARTPSASSAASSRRRRATAATSSCRRSPSAAARSCSIYSRKHYGEWHLARWKIFLDSPMAIAASRVYWKHPDRFDEETTPAARERSAACRRCRISCCRKRPTIRAPSTRCVAARIIIAGSGMANGGRVLHHLKHNLERPECHVVIVGFQAPGTLGRQLVDRHAEVFIHGRRCAGRADPHARRTLGARRPGANYCAGMTASRVARRYYLVHGEVPSAEALAVKAARARCNRDGDSSWPENRTCELAPAGPRLADSVECPAPNTPRRTPTDATLTRNAVVSRQWRRSAHRHHRLLAAVLRARRLFRRAAGARNHRHHARPRGHAEPVVVHRAVRDPDRAVLRLAGGARAPLGAAAHDLRLHGGGVRRSPRRCSRAAIRNRCWRACSTSPSAS